MNDHRTRLKQHCPAMDATPYRVDLERVISEMRPLSIAIVACSTLVQIIDRKVSRRFQGFEISRSSDDLSVFQICDVAICVSLLKFSQVSIHPITPPLVTFCSYVLAFFDVVCQAHCIDSSHNVLAATLGCYSKYTI